MDCTLCITAWLEATPSRANAARPSIKQKRNALVCSAASRTPRMSLSARTATTRAKFEGTARSNGLANAESNSHINCRCACNSECTLLAQLDVFFKSRAQVRFKVAVNEGGNLFGFAKVFDGWHVSIETRFR